MPIKYKQFKRPKSVQAFVVNKLIILNLPKSFFWSIPGSDSNRNRQRSLPFSFLFHIHTLRLVVTYDYVSWLHCVSLSQLLLWCYKWISACVFHSDFMDPHVRKYSVSISSVFVIPNTTEVTSFNGNIRKEYFAMMRNGNPSRCWGFQLLWIFNLIWILSLYFRPNV